MDFYPVGTDQEAMMLCGWQRRVETWTGLVYRLQHNLLFTTYCLL